MVPSTPAVTEWLWRAHRAHPIGPSYRLLFDGRGLPVPEGVEVDLRKLPDDAELTSLPEAGVSVEEYARRRALARD